MTISAPSLSPTTTPARPAKTGTASVIIPTYNHAAYLGDAVMSVLRQTYDRIEIIVVDDGSTDGTAEVVAGFGDRVRYIWQENQGLSAARNAGIRAARGEYIALLDADDMYEPAFLGTMVDLMESAGADGVFCGYRFVDDADRPLPQHEARPVPAGELYRLLLDGNFLVPESMLVRRRCYEGAGLFDESLRACEDWDMWLRLARDYTIVGTGKILTRHRVLAGSMSTDPVRMLENRLAVLEAHLGPAQETVEQRRAYGRAYLTSTVEYLQHEDVEGAYCSFRRMAAIAPALLAEFDTFYELGCGNQPKGMRGHLASLDVAHNADVLIDMLDALFKDAPATLQQKKRRVYATAYTALGVLSYGAQQFASANRFFVRAVVSDPTMLTDRRLPATWVRSIAKRWFNPVVRRTGIGA